MTKFRWRLFKILSTIGWWICPEPMKADLERRMSFDFGKVPGESDE